MLNILLKISEMVGSKRSWHLPQSANSMQRAAKLTLKEFTPAFYNSKPPTGWGKKIGQLFGSQMINAPNN